METEEGSRLQGIDSGEKMGLLDEESRRLVEEYLARLPGPVELVVALGEGKADEEMTALVKELQEISPQVRVRAAVGDEVGGGRRPALGVARPGERARVHFAGAPLGHEFSSLILALLQVSGYPPKVDEGVLAQIQGLEGPIAFEVFVSLSCHNCPEVVQAVNLIAALNPNVSAVTVDGARFTAEAEEREVLAVPTLFVNGKRAAQGRMTLGEVLALVDRAGEERARARVDQTGVFDVLVVGGGPAGAAAAIYAARKGVRTGLVTERFGGQVLDTLAIENFISVRQTVGPKLAAELRAHVTAYPVTVFEGERAEALIPADEGAPIRVQLARGGVLSARAVVVATGARWRELGVPGEREYRGRGVAYCPHCDGPLFKGKAVAVVGGGNSGVEAAIDLAGIAQEVALLEFMPQLKADAVLQERLRALPNVRVVTQAETVEVVGDGERVTGLRYRERRSGEERLLPVAGVFVQIGLLPNTDWLAGTVARNRFGEIEVDSRGATNVRGVFAAGDCTTVPFKQIIIAMGEGAKAALAAFDFLVREG
ncbi:MAG: alkyl hydroperoxide reductase subunit F [Hydrogenophilus sp.]|nr:alkyl hydroperoxide reductase subunit F [Hydrogenophilus sp.]